MTFQPFDNDRIGWCDRRADLNMGWIFDKLFGVALPSDDVIEWLFDTYRWLLTSGDGSTVFCSARLVLPTDEFFPLSAPEGEALGTEVFEWVRKHAGMTDWPCRLEMVPDPEDPREGMGPILGATSSSGAAGTFSCSDAETQAIIRYSSRQIEDAQALIALFAHELAHYYLAALPDDPPGGRDAHEPATDVAASFLGFGIFTANSSFRFQEIRGIASSGYRTSRLGYLGEPSLAYALALFTELQGIPHSTPRPHLKTNPREYHRNAVHDLKKRWPKHLTELRRELAGSTGGI